MGERKSGRRKEWGKDIVGEPRKKEWEKVKQGERKSGGKKECEKERVEGKT